MKGVMCCVFMSNGGEHSNNEDHYYPNPVTTRIDPDLQSESILIDASAG